jgi:formylglycine-generating enzyme required for sulfatase activity
MIQFKQLLIVRFTVLFLILLMFNGDFSVYARQSDSAACSIGEKQDYEKENKVIYGKALKRKKKKIPWLLIIGGAVVAGAVVFLLLSKNDDPEGNDESDYDTNVLGIKWVNIPTSEFRMGDNFNEGYPDEKPVHTVSLDSYYISKYEVTFTQYDMFCSETGRSNLAWGRGSWPVIGVTWKDARAFCDWISQKTGKNIHLPTEAQWEKAARGTDQRRYPWGNGSPNCKLANYYGCVIKIVPVGSYPSGVSPYGVHDMVGNVREWCADWYSSTYYSRSPRDNPSGPSSGHSRVIRGGSWYDDANPSRSANRFYSPPFYRNSYIGFRIVRD